MPFGSYRDKEITLKEFFDNIYENAIEQRKKIIRQLEQQTKNSIYHMSRVIYHKKRIEEIKEVWKKKIEEIEAKEGQ